MGVAAQDLPDTIYVVIDLYGMCVQVSIKPEDPKLGVEVIFISIWMFLFLAKNPYCYLQTDHLFMTKTTILGTR